MTTIQAGNVAVAKSKETHLRNILVDMGSCVVAFSGGVDSSYLAMIAHQELNSRALAVTAESPSYPKNQREQVLWLVDNRGLRHEFIHSRELNNSNYSQNPVNRCYFCKSELYSCLSTIAAEHDCQFVVDGTNSDDVSDYRPGRAAGIEMGVRSPLIEADLGKAEIRLLSKIQGLPTWDQPASACLASRIPYGSVVTEEKLMMIERGEAVLRSLGFRQSRVRHHGDIARIEIAHDELAKVMSTEMFDRLAVGLKAIGFSYVTLDLEGYRTGALNEALLNMGVEEEK